ncbi:DUF3499 domain-containing protein [Tessaracoccus sp. OS52]|nr:DUF3499 domain-containing protein [Tessaracoccus sp. OS52]
MRLCSRTACHSAAVATMTYAYADSTAVLGPLAVAHVPGAFDLCAQHAERTSVPRGWEVIRLPLDVLPREVLAEDDDDLLALADAVRAIGLRHDDVEPLAAAAPMTASSEEGRQLGHLRLLPSIN